MEHVPMTPAIITGMIERITSSGFNTPMEATPTPLLAVPYAAPRSARQHARISSTSPLRQFIGSCKHEAGKALGARAMGARTGEDERERGAHVPEEVRGRRPLQQERQHLPSLLPCLAYTLRYYYPLPQGKAQGAGGRGVSRGQRCEPGRAGVVCGALQRSTATQPSATRQQQEQAGEGEGEGGAEVGGGRGLRLTCSPPGGWRAQGADSGRGEGANDWRMTGEDEALRRASSALCARQCCHFVGHSPD